MEDQAKQRVAMNEATFRKVNEGIDSSAQGAAPLSVICECGRLGCNQVLSLVRERYESVRSNPRRFVVVPGHELPEAEDVVERQDAYFVVEKAGDPVAEVVEQTDPRRPLDL